MPTPEYPIDERIAQAIKTQLLTIRKSAAYQINVVEVVRPVRRDQYTPSDSLAVLQIESYEQGEPEIDALGLKKQRTVVFSIDYFVEPSDDDDRPYDRLRSIAIADLEKGLTAVMADENQRAFSGLGHVAETREPQLIQSADGGSAGVRVTLAVSYRFIDTDPYTPLN